MSRLIFRMLASCGFLLSWLHVLRLLVLLLPCHRPLLRWLRLLLVVQVLAFIMITVVEMGCGCLATRRRLRLVVLHRVMMVLVLEDLR
jgi:hypothetical protein